MKHLQTYNERYIPKLIDSDNDGSYEVDLDTEDLQLKEDTPYEFLNVHFNIHYNSSANNYNAIIQYPDKDNEGTEQYIGWVIYSKSKSDMLKKLRFQIKMYIKQYGEH